MAQVPFLDLQFVNGRAVARGDVTYSGGHVIPREGRANDGSWARWSFDGGRLTADNDRFGFIPLYYYWNNGRLALSPRLLKLVAEIPGQEVDDVSMAVFMRRGFFLGDDTHFKHIKALPPNGRLTWENGQLTVTGGPTIRKPLTIGYDEAMDHYIDLFRASISRRTPSSERWMMPLSGGRDSRNILFELCRQGHKPPTVVTISRFKRMPNDDVDVAAQVAAAKGVHHTIEPYTRSWTSYELTKNARTDFCTDEHSHFEVLRHYAEGRYDCLYDGIAGDTMSAAHFITPERYKAYREHRWEDLADLILGPGTNIAKAGKWIPVASEAALEWLLPPELLKRWPRELAVERIIRELKLHAEAPNPVDSFFLFNRTRREIALSPHQIWDCCKTVYTPFMEDDIFDFIMSLPAEMTMDHNFHTNTIYRAYPEHKDIPFADGIDTGTFKVPFTDNLRWVGRLLAFTMMENPGRLPAIAKYLTNRSKGGDIARVSRGVALYTVQLENALSQAGARRELARVGLS